MQNPMLGALVATVTNTKLYSAVKAEKSDDRSTSEIFNKGGWEHGTICGVARMLYDAVSKGNVHPRTGHERPEGE
jgi:hypothetical protein